MSKFTSAVLKNLFVGSKGRKSTVSLAGLSDRQLSDIGVRRNEARGRQAVYAVAAGHEFLPLR